MNATVHVTQLDELLHIAEVHGWHITDTRRTRAVLWFARGREYIHVGVNVEGELFHLYGGVRGRANRYWVAATDPLTGTPPDRADLLAQALRAEPFDTIESHRGGQD